MFYQTKRDTVQALQWTGRNLEQFREAFPGWTFSTDTRPSLLAFTPPDGKQRCVSKRSWVLRDTSTQLPAALGDTFFLEHFELVPVQFQMFECTKCDCAVLPGNVVKLEHERSVWHFCSFECCKVFCGGEPS